MKKTILGISLLAFMMACGTNEKKAVVITENAIIEEEIKD